MLTQSTWEIELLVPPNRMQALKSPFCVGRWTCLMPRLRHSGDRRNCGSTVSSWILIAARCSLMAMRLRFGRRPSPFCVISAKIARGWSRKTSCSPQSGRTSPSRTTHWCRALANCDVRSEMTVHA